MAEMHTRKIQSDSIAEPSPGYTGFWEDLTVDELAARQGVAGPIDLQDLAIEWPADESVDEFLKAIRQGA